MAMHILRPVYLLTLPVINFLLVKYLVHDLVMVTWSAGVCDLKYMAYWFTYMRKKIPGNTVPVWISTEHCNCSIIVADRVECVPIHASTDWISAHPSVHIRAALGKYTWQILGHQEIHLKPLILVKGTENKNNGKKMITLMQGHIIFFFQFLKKKLWTQYNKT